MNKKMRVFIICAVFALISSCKNYASSEDLKNLEQNVKGKVKGFLDTKERIVSDDPTVYEIAEKLKEEEALKDKKEKKEEKKKEREEKQETKEELIQGDDPNSHSNMQVVKTTRDSGGQQKQEQKQQERKEDKKQEQRKKEEKHKREEYKERREQEIKKQRERERERERQEKEEQKQVEAKIKMLAEKIDEINKDIDDIKQHKSSFSENSEGIRAQKVIDKVTGPIYDHFTDSGSAIYHTWNLEDELDSELSKLLKQLSDTRDSLRTKLNEGNQAATWNNTPSLKENVKVVEIESDLDSLKSELERVKKYLENKSNFETIKEYVSSSYD